VEPRTRSNVVEGTDAVHPNVPTATTGKARRAKVNGRAVTGFRQSVREMVRPVLAFEEGAPVIGVTEAPVDPASGPELALVPDDLVPDALVGDKREAPCARDVFIKTLRTHFI
jgi:hypothetical protein